MTLIEFLRSGQYLPPFLRDFHDQKELFKAIHEKLHRKARKDSSYKVYPESWIDAQIYTIDSFLWFMASCGWTLQRSRKRGVEFRELDEFIDSEKPKYLPGQSYRDIPLSDAEREFRKSQEGS